MKKSVLTCMLALAAVSAYADEPTYNLFDPADCDEEGWLWLDTSEKIAKYVGAGKKIFLIDAPYQIDDPEFPGLSIPAETFADPDMKGFNTEGVQGGEGSKTGAIVLLPAEEGWYVTVGGGILVPMPDCASFDVYFSQSTPNIYSWLEVAKGLVNRPADCKYIWNDDDPSDWFPNDKPLSTNYVAWDMNMQDIIYDYSGGDGTGPDAENWQFYGPKGEARTAAVYNHGVESPLLLQGIRVFTYTDVSLQETGVEGIAAEAIGLTVNGKIVTVAVPSEISVYNAAGAKVAGKYGTSLNCSDLKGLYIVKAGNKSIKAIF